MESVILLIIACSSSMWSYVKAEGSNDTSQFHLHPSCEVTKSCNSTVLQRSFSITCCDRGLPQALTDGDAVIEAFTVEAQGPVSRHDPDCIRYTGHYQLATASLNQSAGVNCKCRRADSDRNCRVLLPCENGANRRYAIGLRCACVGNYFGELCENYCHHGVLSRLDSGKMKCKCSRLFYGTECNYYMCAHGGHPSYKTALRGCKCTYPYTGAHCQYNLLAGSKPPHPNVQEIALGVSLVAIVVLLMLVGSCGCGYVMIIHNRHRQPQAVMDTNLSGRTEPVSIELSIIGIHQHHVPRTEAEQHVHLSTPPPTYEEVLRCSVVTRPQL